MKITDDATRALKNHLICTAGFYIQALAGVDFLMQDFGKTRQRLKSAIGSRFYLQKRDAFIVVKW